MVRLKNAIVNRGFNFPFFLWAGKRFIIDGAGRVAALKELEAEGHDVPDLPVVEIAAETLNEAKALVLQASSSHGEITQESFDIFVGDMDLEPFSEEITFDDFLATDAEGPPPLGDEDDVPEVPGEPASQRGDLYEIGPHRLLCGDSTVATYTERLLDGQSVNLMITDPPYGVEYDPTWGDEAGGQFGDGKTVMRGKVPNDNKIDWREAWALFPGNIAYVWHAGIYAAEVAIGLLNSGFDIRAQIVWAKPHFIMSRGAYHWQHEPCWYAVRHGATADWTGDRKQSTLWEIAGMNPAGGGKEEKLGHGTQKPVECMGRPMKNHGQPGDIVYDPFGGSGSTMVAAHQNNRRCFMMEIDPHYCDVIVARMQKLWPGIEVKKNGEVLNAQDVRGQGTEGAVSPEPGSPASD